MLRPCQHEKLARGAQVKEHAMSQKLNAAIAVIGIDIGKNSARTRSTLWDVGTIMLSVVHGRGREFLVGLA